MTAHNDTQQDFRNDSNVDPAELDKFSEIASQWWDPESEFRPLHEINPLRLDWINQRTPLEGRRVLDVGCGGGILSEAMAQAGADVLGIDLAEASLRIARLHALETGVSVDYRLVSAEDAATDMPGTFDVVTCLEMLEHVPDPGSVVKACAALVKPGGSVYFSTLNRNPKSWLFAIVGAEYVLKLLPRGTHDYRRFLQPAELDSLCRQAGLQLRAITGLTYNPVTQRYRLVPDDVDVNYMLVAERPQD